MTNGLFCVGVFGCACFPLLDAVSGKKAERSDMNKTLRLLEPAPAESFFVFCSSHGCWTWRREFGGALTYPPQRRAFRAVPSPAAVTTWQVRRQAGLRFTRRSAQPSFFRSASCGARARGSRPRRAATAGRASPWRRATFEYRKCMSTKLRCARNDTLSGSFGHASAKVSLTCALEEGAPRLLRDGMPPQPAGSGSGRSLRTDARFVSHTHAPWRWGSWREARGSVFA